MTAEDNPAPADPLDAAHPRVVLRQRPRRGCRAIRAVVIDKHHFPGNAGQRRIERRHHGRDIIALLVTRHDDRKCGGHGLTMFLITGFRARPRRG